MILLLESKILTGRIARNGSGGVFPATRFGTIEVETLGVPFFFRNRLDESKISITWPCWPVWGYSSTMSFIALECFTTRCTNSGVQLVSDL